MFIRFLIRAAKHARSTILSTAFDRRKLLSGRICSGLVCDALVGTYIGGNKREQCAQEHLYQYLKLVCTPKQRSRRSWPSASFPTNPSAAFVTTSLRMLRSTTEVLNLGGVKLRIGTDSGLFLTHDRRFKQCTYTPPSEVPLEVDV